MIYDKLSMGEAVRKLNAYTKSYDEGHPEISDKEWDDLYFELKQAEETLGIVLDNSPTKRVNYDVVTKLNKVTHNHEMLSLDKTKDIDEVIKFLGSNNYIAMSKMDGLTISLKYINGVLVSAETRGNGTVGEDVLNNVLKIKNVPKTITYMDELIVDGECICNYKDFEEFKEEYKNPRNFASGSIRLLDSNESGRRKLSFIAWDIIKGFEEEDSLYNCLDKLNGLGFDVVPVAHVNPATDTEMIKIISEKLYYPIDGVVFKFDSRNYGARLGKTEHHFKNAIAFKFYDDTVETKLLNIEWSIGKTGILTPVAVFEPVEIYGTIVERASLHNISVMQDVLNGNGFKGQKVYVTKRNMIIPQIEYAE